MPGRSATPPPTFPTRVHRAAAAREEWRRRPVCWTADGTTLAVAASQRDPPESSIVLFGADGQQRRRWVASSLGDQAHDEISAICFVGDEAGSRSVDDRRIATSGRYVASVGSSGSCRVWRVADGTCVRAFHSGAPPTHVVSYGSCADHRLACGGRSGAVHILRAFNSPAGAEPDADDHAATLSNDTREAVAMAERGHADGIFSGLQRVLASGASNGEVLRTIEALCMAVSGRAFETADQSEGECVCCMSARVRCASRVDTASAAVCAPTAGSRPGVAAPRAAHGWSWLSAACPRAPRAYEREPRVSRG